VFNLVSILSAVDEMSDVYSTDKHDYNNASSNDHWNSP